MTDAAESHAVDVETFRFGVVLAVLGAVVGPVALVLAISVLNDDNSAAILGVLLLIPGLAGVLCLVVGIRACTVPTAKATVTVSAEDVLVARRTGEESRISWSDVEDWGLARRALGVTRSLVLRPRSTADGESGALWNGRLGGWVLETVDPEPALLATMERLAPRPRRDT